MNNQNNQTSSKILVWDWPVRIGHWLLVSAFIVAWLTGESEAWRLVHVWAGGVMVGVILFRLVWGIVGTRHAQFRSFLRGPQAVMAYLRGLLQKAPNSYPGHNAAGGWSIIMLLALGLATGGSGWWLYQGAGDVWEEIHEGLASAMLLMVLIHITGVIVSGFIHQENLPRAMVDGYKTGQKEEAIPHSRLGVALIMLIWVIICAGWLAQ